MKKALFLLLLIITLTFSLAFKNTALNTFPLFGKLIILDPGHGGLDPGTTYMDEYEKDYNLLFAQTLMKELEKNGATVMLTRLGDYDLASTNTNHRKKNDFDNRIKLINDINPDLYISLHMNYLNNSSYFGSQVFYSDANKQNEILANIVQKHFNNYFKYNKETKKTNNNLYMYKNITSKGILIEYGFISNAQDRKKLKDDNYRIELSTVIIKALDEYFT